MKKILVIMIMVLLCSTSVMAQKGKGKSRNRKAKVERQMTDFEKRQKEEKLANILMWCQYYYNEGDIEDAKRHKDEYEELKNKNYYVEFTNVKWSEKDYADFKKLGIEIVEGRNFYADGMMVMVYFDSDGKAIDRTDFKYRYHYLEYNVKKEVMAKSKVFYNHGEYTKAAKALIDEINELSGYNAKLAKKTNEMEEFIKTTKVEQEVSQIQNRAKQQIKEQERENWPFSETSQANRRFYQQHKSDYSRK